MVVTSYGPSPKQTPRFRPAPAGPLRLKLLEEIAAAWPLCSGESTLAPLAAVLSTEALCAFLVSGFLEGKQNANSQLDTEIYRWGLWEEGSL